MTSEVESDVARLIGPTLEAMGYAVVRVKVLGKGRRTLQVMAEHLDGAGITADDCGEVSRVVSAVLDVEDPFPGPYVLEVSSPGIDRPLIRRGDFERFTGLEARIETRCRIDGHRRFRGRLLGVFEGSVRIALDASEAEIPLEDIVAAKLVLTDELIAMAGNRGRA